MHFETQSCYIVSSDREYSLLTSYALTLTRLDRLFCRCSHLYTVMIATFSWEGGGGGGGRKLDFFCGRGLSDAGGIQGRQWPTAVTPGIQLQCM